MALSGQNPQGGVYWTKGISSLGVTPLPCSLKKASREALKFLFFRHSMSHGLMGPPVSPPKPVGA